MNRPLCNAAVLAVAAILTSGTAPKPLAAQGASRPNVVLILMDDLGYGDVASYGAPDVRTPNIDRLARGGVRFTESYANGAVCSPTRAALITGRYQQRVGLEWVLGPFSDTAHGLRVTPASLPARLKEAGYATGLIGKWHLGYRPEQQPNAHGFDEFFGFLGGIIDYYTYNSLLNRHDLYENGKEVSTDRYSTDEFSDRAVRFIEQHAATPFFLELAYNATHMPFQPPPDSLGKHRNSPLGELPGDPWAHNRADYVRMLERVDEGVGHVLATLETRGIAKNTLVIFTNDNGGEWLSRNDPFTNRKGTLWEGGIRVPLIMYWPDHIPAGKTTGQVALTMDVTASVLALARATPLAEYPLDGIDLMPVVRGDSPVVRRDVFWRLLRPGRTQRAVRSDSWKLLIDGPPRMQGEGGAVTTQVMLFDLHTDPNERHDLAADHQALVGELRRKLSAWEDDVNPPVSAALLPLAQSADAPAVIARYQALKSDSTRLWVFGSSELSVVGYRFLNRKRPGDALAVFELNRTEYPGEAASYGDLGYAYLALPDTARAIARFKDALRINPEHGPSLYALKQLGAKP